MAAAYAVNLIAAVLRAHGFTVLRSSAEMLVMVRPGEVDPPMIVLQVRYNMIGSHALSRQLERLGENPEPYFAELDTLG